MSLRASLGARQSLEYQTVIANAVKQTPDAPYTQPQTVIARSVATRQSPDAPCHTTIVILGLVPRIFLLCHYTLTPDTPSLIFYKNIKIFFCY